MPRKTSSGEAGPGPVGPRQKDTVANQPDILAEASNAFAIAVALGNGVAAVEAYERVQGELKNSQGDKVRIVINTLLGLSRAGLVLGGADGEIFKAEKVKLEALIENITGLQQPRTPDEVPPMTGAKGSPRR